MANHNREVLGYFEKCFESFPSSDNIACAQEKKRSTWSKFIGLFKRGQTSSQTDNYDIFLGLVNFTKAMLYLRNKTLDSVVRTPLKNADIALVWIEKVYPSYKQEIDDYRININWFISNAEKKINIKKIAFLYKHEHNPLKEIDSDANLKQAMAALIRQLFTALDTYVETKKIPLNEKKYKVYGVHEDRWIEPFTKIGDLHERGNRFVNGGYFSLYDSYVLYTDIYNFLGKNGL